MALSADSQLMIRDARALKPGWTPNDLAHRHNDIEYASTCLQPITNGIAGENILVTGPSGAGKTTLARYVTEQLERETLDVRTGEVNCISDSTQHAALHALVRDAGVGLDLSREGTPTAEYLDRLRDSDDHLVLILDEVDSLADPGLLVSLHQLQNVTMLLVCVDETNLRADVDTRVDDRLRSTASLHLDAYSTTELVDILQSRADHGLTHTLGTETAERIADHAAGSARQAIAILRQAATEAGSTGASLSPGLVEDVVTDAEVDIRARNVAQLSSHHRLLLDIVESHGELSAGELHDIYEARASTPKSEATRRRYLTALRRYDLIEAFGNTRDRRYRVTDPGE